jgi:hypothetical protein
MKLSRDIALKIHWVFDQLIPPVLRDQKWFMYLPIRMAFRHKAPYYFEFKEKAHSLTHEEYKQIYDEDHFSFQIDLTFLPQYKTTNKNNYVLFTAININSRYAYFMLILVLIRIQIQL